MTVQPNFRETPWSRKHVMDTNLKWPLRNRIIRTEMERKNNLTENSVQQHLLSLSLFFCSVMFTHRKGAGTQMGKNYIHSKIYSKYGTREEKVTPKCADVVQRQRTAHRQRVDLLARQRHAHLRPPAVAATFSWWQSTVDLPRSHRI